ncbi:MAG TPA: hypothetical protein VJ804_09720 [Acidimicrobiales bacterium]|nr:hypothetical protein [Acidimicrobiales bacterium]
MRVRAVVATALAIGSVVGAPAAAHEVDPTVRTVIDDVAPDVPGLHVEVATSVTTQLVVANDTAQVLEVLDDEGQPFVRIGPDGVEANLAAAAWYLANQPFGGTVPAGTGPDEPPRWARVSAESTWGWFDHRLHATAVTVLGEGRPSTFEVPMRLGDRRVVVRGHLERRTTVPRFAAALRSVPDPSTQLQVQLLEGRAPGLFVRYLGAGEATVEGADGEPFLRLRPSGAEVNRRSPTWLFSAQARGEDLGGVVADPAAPPEWVSVGTSPSYAWLDPRALIAEAGDQAVEHPWVVPVLVDGRRVEVAGTSTASVTPLEDLARAPGEETDRRWVPWAVGLAALGTVGLVLLLLLGRRVAARG